MNRPNIDKELEILNEEVNIHILTSYTPTFVSFIFHQLSFIIQTDNRFVS